MKHTKGKWSVVVSKWAEVTIEAINENGIMDVMAQVFTINQNEAEANANLISSAPEMLALLKEMATDENELRFALCRLFGTKKGNSLSRQIKDLIAKAEGRESK